MALNPSSGWSYYKQLNISDTNDVSANYQMQLKVYADEGTDDPDNGIVYCDNHCENFPNDIRFGTTSNPQTAEQLPQWIEEYDDNSATIWIKLPSDGSDTIYMFVGNSSASLFSDGEEVFIFYDDFADDDYSGWTEYGGTIVGVEEVDGEKVLHTHTTGNPQTILYTSQSFDRGVMIEAYLKVTSKYTGLGFLAQGQNDFYISRGYYYSRLVLIEDGGFQWRVEGDEKTENIWYVYKTWFNNSIIYADIDGSTVSKDDSTFSSGYIGIASWYGDEADQYLSWIRVRKYADPEPSWSSFGEWTSLETASKSYHLDTITYAEYTKPHDINTVLQLTGMKTYNFDTQLSPVEKVLAYSLDTRLRLEGPYNLTIYNFTFSSNLWCTRWDEDNWRIIIEAIADKTTRDNIRNNIVPGAVAELYNILGKPQFVDTTYSSGNTITLLPKRMLSNLRDEVTVAVKSYSETMLRWDMFRIKLECVKL